MAIDNVLDLMERHGFQRVFKEKLLENKEIVEGFNKDYNLKYAIDEDKLFTYLYTTQEKSYNKAFKESNAKSKFVKYLRDEIAERGLLDVLRNPVKWNAAHFDMMIKKPHTNLNPEELKNYTKNRLDIIVDYLIIIK